MKTLKANWIPLAALVVVALLVHSGKATVEQAAFLAAAVVLPGVRKGAAGGLVALLGLSGYLVACHPLPAGCAPGEATKREKKCVADAMRDCDKRADKKTCYREWRMMCRTQRELWVARCTQ